MAVETEGLDLLPSLRLIRVHCPVAGHAGLVFFRKGRQFGAYRVTGTALSFPWGAWFKLPDSVFPQAGLTVDLVAPDTVTVFLWILNFFPAVFSRCQITFYLIMTRETHFRRKEITPSLVHLRRIRVQGLIGYVPVTILT
jgi:hypothetical protein